jgi:hypothetical protein
MEQALKMKFQTKSQRLTSYSLSSNYYQQNILFNYDTKKVNRLMDKQKLMFKNHLLRKG